MDLSWLLLLACSTIIAFAWPATSQMFWLARMVEVDLTWDQAYLGEKRDAGAACLPEVANTNNHLRLSEACVGELGDTGVGETCPSTWEAGHSDSVRPALKNDLDAAWLLFCKAWPRAGDPGVVQ